MLGKRDCWSHVRRLFPPEQRGPSPHCLGGRNPRRLDRRREAGKTDRLLTKVQISKGFTARPTRDLAVWRQLDAPGVSPDPVCRCPRSGVLFSEVPCDSPLAEPRPWRPVSRTARLVVIDHYLAWPEIKLPYCVSRSLCWTLAIVTPVPTGAKRRRGTHPSRARTLAGIRRPALD
jgi:hypothetical protein